MKIQGGIVPVHDRVAATVLKADIGPAVPLADRTLHPNAPREPLVLKQTLPAEWAGSMRLSLSNALAYEGPDGGDPIDLAQTTFPNAQLPRTVYLVGDGCGLGGASFAAVVLSDCVTNIPLHIIGVNATLDGVAENDEETPGGFIADRITHTNAPRKALALEALGPATSPGTLNLTWNSSLIQMYSAPDGGTPLAQYSVPFANFTSTNLYVEGIAPGSNVLHWTYSEQTNCVDRILVTVLKVEIKRPKGSLDANPNPGASWLATTERFDFQGIVAGADGSYVLDVEGEIDPIPPASYKWTLNDAAGTLANDTTATPTHTAPADEGEGMLTLKAMVGATDTGCKDERKVKIYKDCLARDMATFGTGGSCDTGWKVTSFNVAPQPVMALWNCHGSTHHLYDGSGNGQALSLPAVGAPKKVVEVTHQAGGGGSHPPLGTLNRGDIVAYYTAGGQLMHSQTCTGNGTETYGANNEPLSYPGAPRSAPSGGNESYKWATSTAGDWANDLYYPDFTAADKAVVPDPTPVTIKVYDKL